MILGICHGDSGGPLMKLGPNNHYEVIGVASNLFYGNGCSGQATYTRTSEFVPWIMRNIDQFQDPYFEFYVSYEQIISPDFTYNIYWMHKLSITILQMIFLITLFSSPVLIIWTVIFSNYSKDLGRLQQLFNFFCAIFWILYIIFVIILILEKITPIFILVCIVQFYFASWFLIVLPYLVCKFLINFYNSKFKTKIG